MAAALIDVPFSTSHFAPVTARITPRAHRAAATTRCLPRRTQPKWSPGAHHVVEAHHASKVVVA
jgi:hypothetical protein